MNTVESDENITIEEDVSINLNNTPEVEVIEPLVEKTDDPLTKQQPLPCLKKVDRRSISSKKNALKARLAKQAKYLRKKNKMKELFGDSSSSDSDSTDETASESEEDIFITKRRNKKKNLFNRQQQEIEELKEMVFKLAKKQKKYKKKKHRVVEPLQSPAPIINYNITHPVKETEPEKKTKTSKSIFMQNLRKTIIDED